MKKTNKILMGIFTLSILFTVFNLNTVLAAEPSTTSVDVDVDTYQHRVLANQSIMFAFQERTRIRFNSTMNIDVNINCEALKIGVKEFELEIDHNHDIQINMTCTEEQSELGLLKGNRYQIRNRNRLLYQEGFCVKLQANCSCEVQAKLKIEATNQNRAGTWAYYDEAAEEWVAVPSSINNGYLVAETDHFSFWTVLIPESDNNFLIYITIGIVSVIGIVAIISVILLKRRK
jgi:hypothetical protein